MSNTNGDLTVPRVWYQGQRVLRTIVEALVVLVPVVNGIAIAAVTYMNEQTDIHVPGSVFVVLNAVIAATAFIMGLTSKIAALDKVNTFLTKFGLGSVPKSALTDIPSEPVVPDPKA